MTEQEPFIVQEPNSILNAVRCTAKPCRREVDCTREAMVYINASDQWFCADCGRKIMVLEAAARQRQLQRINAAIKRLDEIVAAKGSTKVQA